MKRIKVSFTAIVLSLLTVSGLQAQLPQPLHFASFTSPAFGFNPIPTRFNWIPAEEEWIIHVLCTGPDGIIDPPEYDIMSPNYGGPTNDDFLADLVQNAFNTFYHNGYSLFGPGYEGTFISPEFIVLPMGEGTEPVINIGDWLYIRSFNSDLLVTATSYAEMIEPLFLQYSTPGIPDTVYNIYLMEWAGPVEMTLFTATGGDGKVTLHWVTQSEKENDHFNLYKYTEEEGDYCLLTQIPGHGTTSLQHDYYFTDHQVINGTKYYYKIADVDINGAEEFYHQTISATPGTIGTGEIADEYELCQNYPNPFNAETTIRFKIVGPGSAKLTVYDIEGREIAVLLDQELENNTYEVVFNADDLPTGIYFYELMVNDFYEVGKMVLIK